MENNIKNNLKILKEQILELQSVFDKIIGNMGNEEIKKFYEIRYETTKTVKTIEEMIGVENENNFWPKPTEITEEQILKMCEENNEKILKEEKKDE